ncbi:MAG: 6,7-dimethyl-8-ribityllumazine synthase [Terriglobia bacterium]
MKREAPRIANSALGANRTSRVAIIRAEYNAEITRGLEAKCLEGLREGGIRRDHIECYEVPGCFEIPLLAQRLAALKRFDLMIALGAVVRGETLHFELVANECARGVMAVTLKHNVPVIFEVLATYNRRDALRRAGNNRLNKGFEAAQAALATLATLRRLEA